MKHYFTSITAISALAILFLFNTGCVKEDDFDMDKMAQGQWNPEMAIPLVHSGLALKDIISITDDGLFTVNNHVVSLVYKTNIYTKYGYEFFAPVNQSESMTIQMFSIDSTTLYQTGTASRSISHSLPLTFPNGEQIDSMVFRRGDLRINLTSDIPHPGNLNITIPSATKNGVPFNKSVPFTEATSNTIFTQDVFDMTGYSMKTTHNGMPNMLDVSYTLTFDNSNTSLPALNKNFNFTLSFDSITPAALFGYFGQSEFIVPSDTSEVSLFNNFQTGSIYFDSPEMTVSLENSFGMPIDANITTLAAILEDGSVMPVTGPIPSPLIDYPLSFGQSATNSFTFDKNNSNIQQIVNAVPKYFVYNISAGTNSPLPTYNFMSDSSVFKADLQIVFPMKGFTSGFTIQDTVDFSIGAVEMIESAEFRINVTNGFPVHAHTQLYFVDDNFVILDSMLTTSQNRLIDAAEIDENGRATTPAIRTTDEMFAGDRLQHLFSAKKILIKGIIDTKDAPNSSIQLYDDYALDFKIGVRTKLKLEF